MKFGGTSVGSAEAILNVANLMNATSDASGVDYAYGFWMQGLLQASFACLSLVWIENYNGRRGKGLKYLFYTFYPAHLLVLVLVRFLMG